MESILSLLHSTSSPDFPFQYSSRVVEKKASSLTLSEWLHRTSFLKHTQPLILLSIVRRPTTTYRSKTNNSQLCEKDEDNKVTTPNEKVNLAQVKQDDSDLFLALAWPKQLSNNPKRCLQPQQPRSNPKLWEDNSPKLTMTTMATLHSPKIGEKYDSQTWTKEKHKHRPQLIRRTSMNLHTIDGEKTDSQH